MTEMLPNTSSCVSGRNAVFINSPAIWVALPILLYISSLPRVTTVVGAIEEEVNRISWYSQAIGLEPSIALRAYAGTMIASEFVQEKPIKPWSDAILA